MKTNNLYLSNVDVFKVWLFADVIIGLFALFFCIIQKNNFSQVASLSLIGGLIGLIYSIPSLILLLFFNLISKKILSRINQFYSFGVLIVIVNVIYFIVFILSDFFSEKKEALVFILTTLAGLISLLFVNLKKLNPMCLD